MTLPRTLGIRHVALRVRDLARVERFYVQVLGFEVEWRPDPENVYLRSAADNLALHSGRDEDARGALDHFGIAVPGADDVDAWASHLRACGLALRSEPETHRDGARSFYFEDPEGNRIQIIHHPPIARPA